MPFTLIISLLTSAMIVKLIRRENGITELPKRRPGYDDWKQRVRSNRLIPSRGIEEDEESGCVG